MTIRTQPRTVTLPSGITLEYVEQGDPAGTPVIMLHGVTDSWRSYEPLLPFLPPRLRVFAISQRGHGNSDRPESGYLMQDFAADVAAFMDAFSLDQAVVVGMSMGSSVAQRFAADHPDRVSTLVLMASFYRYDDKPELVEFVEQAILPLTDPIDPDFAREFQKSTLGQPIAPELLEMFVSESAKVPAHVWKDAFGGFISNGEPAAVNRITAPTLVIWGDQDAYCPRQDQDSLLSEIADSRMIVYEGHGHATHWEAPERVAADIVAFIDEINGR